MRRSLYKRPSALRDLLRIWHYSAENWDTSQADKYLDQIEAAANRLPVQPMSGIDCSDLRPGYRRIRAANHHIYFVVTSERIDIVRVLHPSQDAETQLSHDEE